jgi:hypothetical protein
MPFNLLIGAAPNAIAYESKQFTTGEFFGYGWIPSIVLMAVLAVFVYIIWPLMGMPVVLPNYWTRIWGVTRGRSVFHPLLPNTRRPKGNENAQEVVFFHIYLAIYGSCGLPG